MIAMALYIALGLLAGAVVTGSAAKTLRRWRKAAKIRHMLASKTFYMTIEIGVSEEGMVQAYYTQTLDPREDTAEMFLQLPGTVETIGDRKLALECELARLGYVELNTSGTWRYDGE